MPDLEWKNAGATVAERELCELSKEGSFVRATLRTTRPAWDIGRPVGLAAAAIEAGKTGTLYANGNREAYLAPNEMVSNGQDLMSAGDGNVKGKPEGSQAWTVGTAREAKSAGGTRVIVQIHLAPR